ncbi:MAG: PIN domain nuclease [Dehalococcoidia bacterium]|nr:PIN domain nuclease [Dehalococcoidia bacterium]MDW8119455.1 PIN domain nuclease [Chloroflexota bacterium]
MSTPALAPPRPKLPVRWRRPLRWTGLGMVLLAGVGILVVGWWSGLTPLVWGAGAGIGLGILLRGIRWLIHAPPLSLFLSLLGSILGLAMGALATPALARLPGALGVYLPLAITLLLGVAGAWVALARQKALLEAFPRLERLAQASRTPPRVVLLDASALIDGRIASLVGTGVLQETLAVPRFVLDELRRTAASNDAVHRTRGRRGLEVWARLRRERRIALTVVDANRPADQRSEARFLALAQRLKATVFTADSTLARLAQGQGLSVININDLAAALHPPILPGEVLQVRLIQEGREPGQGVGFLDDGTMVVVEGGQRYINQFVDVVVMRTHQTASGRILFAQPREAQSRGADVSG